MLVRNRAEAGALLAERLEGMAPATPVVLGLPRGGVPVAAVIAGVLRAPLDVIVVRKLGVPHHEELAMGAVGEDGTLVVDHAVVARAGVSDAALAVVERRERARVVEQAARFRAARPLIPLQGRAIILVDDGLATGSSMLAACRVVRAQGPSWLAVAVPVAPAASVELVRRTADEVVCLHTPQPFMAVGLWYHDFTQVPDADVVELLKSSIEPDVG